MRALLPTPPAKEVSHESLLLSQKKLSPIFWGVINFTYFFTKLTSNYDQLVFSHIWEFVGISMKSMEEALTPNDLRVSEVFEQKLRV